MSDVSLTADGALSTALVSDGDGAAEVVGGAGAGAGLRGWLPRATTSSTRPVAFWSSVIA